MDTTLTAKNAGTITVGSYTVNRLGFGAMRLTGPGIWGEPADPATAQAVLRRAVELDINFIDTADAYGPNVSENLIAATLAPYPADVVIATKGGLTRSGPNEWTPDGSPAHLREALAGSLQRLKLSQIPVYQFHRPDPKVPFMESLQALIELQQTGQIKHLGLSNVTTEQLRQAIATTEIVSVQNRYNLADRDNEAVLQLCTEQGIAFIPYFPLGSGQLTAADGPLAPYAAKYQATTGQIALAWLLQHSPVMLPIPGTSSVAHLEENVAAANLALEAADIAALDQFRG